MYTAGLETTTLPPSTASPTEPYPLETQYAYAGRGGGGRGPVQEGKLFLGGLDNNTTQQTVNEYCSQWYDPVLERRTGLFVCRGKVTDVVVMENRGFGFVTFEDPPSAQRFLDAHHHEIDEKQIEAKAAVPRRLGGSSQLTKKMFVGGTGEISDEEFRLHFDKYGEIEDAAIVRKDGISRGFGFVTFKNEMSVEKCLVECQVLPNGRRVDIKRAVPREQLTNSYVPNTYDISYSSSRPHGGMLFSPYGPTGFGYGGYGPGYGGGYGIGGYVGRGGYGVLDSQTYRRFRSARGFDSSDHIRPPY